MGAIVEKVGHTKADLVEAVGGIAKYCMLPELKWENKYHAGGTGYIDGVRPSDLSAPLMRGIDSVNRPYLAARVCVEWVGELDERSRLYLSDRYNCEAGKLGATTVFQRYIDSGSPWVDGNHHGPETYAVDNAVELVKGWIANGETTIGNVKYRVS